jgi:hypothetical protein
MKIYLAIILYLLSLNIFAVEDEGNRTGIYIGNGNTYYAIHQTDKQVMLIMLSAIEATGDILSSVYVGNNFDDMSSLGIGYYPINTSYPPNVIRESKYDAINKHIHISKSNFPIGLTFYISCEDNDTECTSKDYNIKYGAGVSLTNILNSSHGKYTGVWNGLVSNMDFIDLKKNIYYSVHQTDFFTLFIDLSMITKIKNLVPALLVGGSTFRYPDDEHDIEMLVITSLQKNYYPQTLTNGADGEVKYVDSDFPLLVKFTDSNNGSIRRYCPMCPYIPSVGIDKIF